MLEEKFSPEEVAMIQSRNPEDVERDVQRAIEFLKQKLVDIGLIWTPGPGSGMFGLPGDTG